MKLFFTLLLVTSTLFSTAKAQEFHVTFHNSAWHLGATVEFNEGLGRNPGIGLGVSWGEKVRYGLEVGAFKNSYYEWSSYVSGFAQYRIIDGATWDIYTGVAVTFAEYPNLVGFADKVGIPRINNHIMIPSLSLIIDHGNYAISNQFIFGGDKFDLLITSSIQFKF